MLMQQRSPWQISRTVWKALLLREALSRLFGSRAAWFWLLAEPVFHVSYMLVIFSVIRVRHIGGIGTPLWLMVGMLAFFMFRRTATQAGKAVSANRSLFAYRQVKPADAVLVRSLLEAVLIGFIFALLLGGLLLINQGHWPADPATLLLVMAALWVLGMGWGLVTSVATELAPEMGKLLDFVMRPLMLLSGVIFPLGLVPEPWLGWLLLNPIAHGLEAVRLAFAPYYHAVPGLSVPYLLACALVLFFAGLVLHRHYAARLTAA